MQAAADVPGALDNVKARLYVDQQCVFYGKPLLESGKLQAKLKVDGSAAPAGAI